MDALLRRTSTRALLVLALAALAAPAAAHEPTRLLGDDRALARLAWEEFVAANSPAEGDHGLREWETWASAALVYLPRRAEDPPRWGEVNGRRIEEVLAQQQVLALQRAREPELHPDDVVEILSSPSEVRYNRVTFDWIVLSSLWNLDGQLQQYRYMRQGLPVSIAFPADSVVVKAVWKPLSETDDATRYYTITLVGETYGLIAFHIIGKYLPDWFWATFEQVDNPDRPLVSHYDAFGYPLGDDEEMSEDLRMMFRQAGMSPELWGHYRLNGEVVAFTDATGRPQVLANSIIEAGVTTRSSCMTCHSRVTIGEEASRLTVEPVVGDPDPSWFWTEAAERQPVFLQLDFLWSLARAQPLLPPETDD